MSTYNYKIFNCFNRKYTIIEPGPPNDVKYVFYKFSAGSETMSANQLWRFLVEHQGESDCTASDSAQIVEKIVQLRKQNQETGDAEKTTNSDEVQGLSIDEFFHFLLLDDFNAPLNPQVSFLKMCQGEKHVPLEYQIFPVIYCVRACGLLYGVFG